ncbi:MAG: rpoN2 [Betaproteobacteria bacterium]|nr:rpoN2 [Betaproteobacteria bacterium]
MKAGMELGMRQHMVLTPRMQQALRLLQLSSLELTQEIEQALVSNPFLESAESESNDFAPAASSESAAAPEQAPQEVEPPGAPEADSWPMEDSGGSRASRGDDTDDGDWTGRSEAPVSLHDHLRGQLLLSQMHERDRALAQFVLEALDEDGYLRVELEELAQMIPEEHNVEAGELCAMLRLLQTLEPAGVGARCLQECLLLQLERAAAEVPGRALARDILANHLDLLAHRQFSKLQELTGCSEPELHAARVLIRSLDPRPGNQFGTDHTRYVVPDVLVSKIRGQWQAVINPAAQPRLHINQAYAGAAGGGHKSGKSDNAPLMGQLQEARWLIKNVEQRFTTIQRVADAILTRQRGFFDNGELSMKPLVLKQIAEELDLHESTICRVTNGKYMATPRGLFEFKHFFSRQLDTEHGPSSATAVRALIKELIKAENPAEPMSDAQIAQTLHEQGLRVARRTVTKYRNLMKLPSVELRRVMKNTAATAIS